MVAEVVLVANIFSEDNYDHSEQLKSLSNCFELSANMIVCWEVLSRPSASVGLWGRCW